MLRPEFDKHLMNERGDKTTTRIAELCSQFTAELEMYCPQGRYLSLAKTAVEQACQWAITVAALDPANVRKPEPSVPMGGGRHG